MTEMNQEALRNPHRFDPRNLLAPFGAAVGELSLRLFFVGANGAQCTINCYGASVEILS